MDDNKPAREWPASDFLRSVFARLLCIVRPVQDQAMPEYFLPQDMRGCRVAESQYTLRVASAYARFLQHGFSGQDVWLNLYADGS